jgi:hypothetical protein
LYTTKSPVGINFEVYNHLNGVYNYIMENLTKLEQLHAKYQEFRTPEAGPVATIYESVGAIFDEALQGSNQPGVSSDRDSIWSRTELDYLVEACEANLRLLAAIL